MINEDDVLNRLITDAKDVFQSHAVTAIVLCCTEDGTGEQTCGTAWTPHKPSVLLDLCGIVRANIDGDQALQAMRIGLGIDATDKQYDDSADMYSSLVDFMSAMPMPISGYILVAQTTDHATIIRKCINEQSKALHIAVADCENHITEELIPACPTEAPAPKTLQ